MTNSMNTLKQFVQGIDAIPAGTAWYADLSAALGGR